MKNKKILLVLFLLFIPSLGFADEYVLIMSKDDNVCQHMLKLYNDDLKKNGEIKYSQHNEFSTITWEKKKCYSLDKGFKHYRDVLMSKFDINNDGDKEIVIKDESVSIRDIEGQSIYFFRKEDSEYFKGDEFDMTAFRRAIGKLTTTIGDSYKLKELPQFVYLGIGGKESKAYHTLGIYIYLHPFFFKGSYYLDMNDNVPYDNKGIYSRKFLVILKYTEDNQINDTCYFRKVYDGK
jgi:hypothetical protein